MFLADKTLTINKARLEERINALAQIGKISETGVCRLALSPEDKEAVETVKGWMEEAGLTARIDHFGNLIGRLEGRNPEAPVLMIGSHIDSQPYAGRFDGVIGVLGALEAAQTLKELNITPNMPIEIVAFCDEEGCRFNKGLFGVRGILGKLEEGELDRTDKSGITRKEALIEFGCDPEKFKDSEYPSGGISAFIELHIEQGPILEAKDTPVGIVTGISGPLWLTVELEGFAGHAGSVPMHMRQDALVGAAKIVVALNELTSEDVTAPTVGTVGSMKIFPDSRNIIPEKVSFTIDLRDIEIERRDFIENLLRKKIHTISELHGLTYTISEDTNSEPRYCSERIMKIMKNESSHIGLNPIELMSGPFHDSLAMSYECEYGMIFVRCKDGISHNPKEYSTMEDISIGTELLYRTAMKMALD
ncbi:M20 family metallo-hydrolase [Metabacillus sp. CT-WN-B3]|uniref:M20 family metallo-hydrolase n=1 Tax=Metabacillus hrfriensis TaxID=3048891 RepID=A0ACD4RIA8_9BACI|nr:MULTISPECIES: M20 family metallo-hydrolase [Metabacillus]UAL54721.1 M20 family metallo-hydrolase [Metabacillus dongyingensis]WHZ60245.1 M20 family metallo-hydrolase [Metabacillus sp. CT-WN-B3]